MTVPIPLGCNRTECARAKLSAMPGTLPASSLRCRGNGVPEVPCVTRAGLQEVGLLPTAAPPDLPHRWRALTWIPSDRAACVCRESSGQLQTLALSAEHLLK